MKKTKKKAPVHNLLLNTQEAAESFDLQLFGDGGESGDGNSADAVQGSDGGTDTDTDNEFAALIKGKYKDAFTRKTQSIINKRFKETKILEEYKARSESVFQTLGAKYGLAPDDLEGILACVEKGVGQGGDRQAEFREASTASEGALGREAEVAELDERESSSSDEEQVSRGEPADDSETALYDGTDGDKAEEKSPYQSTDGDKAEEKISYQSTDGGMAEKKSSSQSTAEKIRRELAFEKRSENTVRQYADWMAQSRELQSLYPELDLERECEDPRFRALLVGGASVKAAYEALHHDEILSGAMEYTARAVSEAVSRSIRARGNRPFENGLGSKAALHPSKDVNSLTDSDISEILKQVAKGKIIKF